MQQEPTLPEVTPQQLAEWIQSQPELRLLDVREPYELPRARISDPRVLTAPLSELARKSVEALPETLKSDRATPVVIFCHYGSRSAQVASWLLDLGWQNVYNLSGGIDAYARTVDPAIGVY